MSGRVAIDFGTSNTVVACWDEATRSGRALSLADYSQTCGDNNATVPLVPSLIHYSLTGEMCIGAQVPARNLYHSPNTFRWMKRYVANRSPIRQRIGGRELSAFDAGKDFLTHVMGCVAAHLDIRDEEIALTVPVDSYEPYRDWLTGVAESAGFSRWRIIDEPSAAILGYGAHPQPGRVYLGFDFGGGTLDAAVVRVEDADAALERSPCRVLGKAGLELGGSNIDQWLFQEVLAREGRTDSDETVRRLSRSLLVECERAKERLSAYERTDIGVTDPDCGATLGAALTRADLEALLDRHGLALQINRTISRAISLAHEKGYGEDDISAVLMVGGVSMMPYVQRAVRSRFASDRVYLDRPMDAVARGAASFVAGSDFYDHIHHDYAVRWFNPVTAKADYKVIVPRGTAYPTPDAVATEVVSATWDGQELLGIFIYEMGATRARGNDASSALELVFDASGSARIVQVAPEEEQKRWLHWLNEQHPTFLKAEPAAKKGERCFALEFGVDAGKRLTLTATDLRSGRTLYRKFPVVKLN